MLISLFHLMLTVPSDKSYSNDYSNQNFTCPLQFDGGNIIYGISNNFVLEVSFQISFHGRIDYTVEYILGGFSLEGIRRKFIPVSLGRCILSDIILVQQLYFLVLVDNWH